MGELHQQNGTLFAKQLFNEQQSQAIFTAHLKSPNFAALHFDNVGIKIMRQVLPYFTQALKTFHELDLQSVQIHYDWNHIMMKPQLVCYDKNKWKTLQQLANWNKEWNELFTESLALKTVTLDLSITWMDQQFLKCLLEGLTRLPNLQQVLIRAKSKDPSVEDILSAFQQAHMIPVFEFKFEKI